MKKNWVEAINHLNKMGDAFVLVTLLGTRGSTPRNSGTKMVVSADSVFDTIGGGHLEYKVIATAHQLLANNEVLTKANTDLNANINTAQHIEHYPLGPTLGQCCGGSTAVLFERFSASKVNIMLFGAGHVGQALVSILAELPCRISWVDSREGQFSHQIHQRKLPSNVATFTSDYPADEMISMPDNSYYLVMTHNHQLDFEICESILQRDSFRYLGLIGSSTKWKRFQQRFAHKNYPEKTVQRIRCPIGLSEIPGKHPMEVAVSIAGEIINLYHKDRPSPIKEASMHWKNLKQLINKDLDKQDINQANLD